MTFNDFNTLYINGVEMNTLSADGVLLFKKDANLPYIPLEYVESDRSQYVYAIDELSSQFHFANPGIDVKFRWMDDNPVASNPHTAFGCERFGNANYRWTINNWTNRSSISGYMFTGLEEYSILIQNQSYYRITVTRNDSIVSYDPSFPNYITLEKDDQHTGFPMRSGRTDYVPQDYYNGNHFCLFGAQHSSGVEPVANRLTAKLWLYYFKAYNYHHDGSPYLVCDLVPAKDKATGRVGLWDKLNKKMKYSVTSSDLIAGPEA